MFNNAVVCRRVFWAIDLFDPAIQGHCDFITRPDIGAGSDPVMV